MIIEWLAYAVTQLITRVPVYEKGLRLYLEIVEIPQTSGL